MRALFRKLRDARFRYEPLIVISIHRDRILGNLAQFQAIDPRIAVAPVIKANAYGHGLIQTAAILESQHLPFICIDSYFEALMLRNEGIKTPLLIIGYTPSENIRRSKLKKISFTITSLAGLKKLSFPAAIHLKIDTGMHRQGILIEELDEALDIIEANPRIILEGICSHLADADSPESQLTNTQIERWNSVVQKVREKISGVKYFHLSNTAGSHYVSNIDANVMRLGIGLYGFNTSNNKKLELTAALEMKSRITSVRTIEAGEKVGYNSTFEATQKMAIATIPVGYAEGIDRRLSNRWAVTISGIECPAIGRINMNITSIDVSRVVDATGVAPQIDDEVLVISSERGTPNSVEAMATACNTIPYEILTGLPAQIRRTII